MRFGAIASGQAPAQVDQLLERLSVLADESFFLTQVSVVIALGQMETPRAIGILQRLSNRTTDGRVKRMAEEAIKKVQSAVGSDQNLKSIQSEMDELKKSNQELKSRLAELEAKAK